MHGKVSPADFIPLFFMFMVLGFATSVFFVPGVEQPAAAPSLPTALEVPATLDTTVEDVPKKIGATQAVHKAQTHLVIPTIKVDVPVDAMGLTPQGAMAVPGNNTEAGWFSLGTRPGQTGSAVIGGHNRFNSSAGVFAQLNQLKKGDLVLVVDAAGTPISFMVRDIQTYDATDTNTGIFASESGVHLNLITCSGDWDPSTESYAKRLVVFTDIVQLAQEPSAGLEPQS